MKKISGEKCIELIKEAFPRFLKYWKVYLKDFGSDNGLNIQMIPFGEYVVDAIKSNDESEIKKKF